MISFEHWPSTIRAPARTSSKYRSGLRWSFPSGGPSVATVVAFIFAQCILTRAKAIRAPSMHVERFTASTRGSASTSHLTRPK